MFQPVLQSLATIAFIGSQILGPAPGTKLSVTQPGWSTLSCQKTSRAPEFLVMAGGASPASNEISLEKNVLFFQRTLKVFGYDPARTSIYFANGNDGQATVRYINQRGRQQFKVPTIPHLAGASSFSNLQTWFQQTAPGVDRERGIFFYFTGHGALNRSNSDNNSMMLWNSRGVSVRQFATLLDQVPPETPFVTMMAQCYAGSFANLIYEGGDPSRPVAAQSRCGFFATIQTLPSVGCTPAVNEADYEDYSSSFFSGLSGRSRSGKPVPSADYNQDSHVSYNEAHAFAKVDGHTTDLPISTSEAWLQNLITEQQQNQLFDQPISEVLKTARPEQRYVTTTLLQKLGLNSQMSYNQALKRVDPAKVKTEEQKTYLVRVGMELTNIGMEQMIRRSGDQSKTAVLNRLLKCESGWWGK